MLVFCENKILVRNNIYDFEESYIYSHEGLEIINASKNLPPNWQNLTQWLDVKAMQKLFSGENFIGLRELCHLCGNKIFYIASGAWQYANWFRNIKFCSHCGGKIIPSSHDYGRKCENCGMMFYVTQSPAIIVAVENEGKLLLAHNSAWPEDRYSVIAGFVEPGERLEDTVIREIHEEVAIDVSDIKYFGSQTWPFPNSLMLGFTAKYLSGEIRPDGTEITKAGFFAPREIERMNIPDKASIARRLIDSFLASHSSD